MMLTIDTSGTLSGLAITDGQRVLAELQWQSGRRHSEQVLPQLDALCRLVEITPQQIGHIAVALGPGSWSGIRVGISIAKGLTLATDATIIGVASLDAIAWSHRGNECQAVIALGRGRYAVATYPATDWAPGSISATNVAVIEPLTSGPLLCDSDTAAAIHIVHPTVTPHIIWPRPLTYAQIAAALLRQPAPTPFTCEPIYLGDPVQR